MIAPLDPRNSRMEDAARVAAQRDKTFREDREPTIATAFLSFAVNSPLT